MKSKILYGFALLGSITFSSCKQHNSQAKYFEGSVTYKFDVSPYEDSSNLFKQFGRGGTLLFKDGNFFHKYDSCIYATDIYNKEENKMYIQKAYSDTTLVIDCGLSGSEIKSLTLNSKKETILGILCDELIIHYEGKTVVDYFNPDTLTINPEWFRKFNFDEEYRIDKKEKSIFLKRRIVYPEYTITQTATNISVEAIDSKIFTVSPKAILVTPY
jgi:hypothetical protein